MATKKKAKAKKAVKKAAKKPAKAPAKKADAKKPTSKTASPAVRQNIERQLDEIRAALDELGQEFETFRQGVTRSSRALLNGVAGFRQALSGVNPLNPASLRQAATRLVEGVQRFVRSLQDR